MVGEVDVAHLLAGVVDNAPHRETHEFEVGVDLLVLTLGQRAEDAVGHVAVLFGDARGSHLATRGLEPVDTLTLTPPPRQDAEWTTEAPFGASVEARRPRLPCLGLLGRIRRVVGCAIALAVVEFIR